MGLSRQLGREVRRKKHEFLNDSYRERRLQAALLKIVTLLDGLPSFRQNSIRHLGVTSTVQMIADLGNMPCKGSEHKRQLLLLVN